MSLFSYFPKINPDAFHLMKQQFNPSSTFVLRRRQNNTVERGRFGFCRFVMWPTLDSIQAVLRLFADIALFYRSKARHSTSIKIMTRWRLRWWLAFLSNIFKIKVYTLLVYMHIMLWHPYQTMVQRVNITCTRKPQIHELLYCGGLELNQQYSCIYFLGPFLALTCTDIRDYWPWDKNKHPYSYSECVKQN